MSRRSLLIYGTAFAVSVLVIVVSYFFFGHRGVLVGSDLRAIPARISFPHPSSRPAQNPQYY